MGGDTSAKYTEANQLSIYQFISRGVAVGVGWETGGGLDRFCDKVCLLRYHTVIKGLAVSHGHYPASATGIISILITHLAVDI